MIALKLTLTFAVVLASPTTLEDILVETVCPDKAPQCIAEATAELRHYPGLDAWLTEIAETRK